MSRAKLWFAVILIGVAAAFVSFWANVWWFRFMQWFNR